MIADSFRWLDHLEFHKTFRCTQIIKVRSLMSKRIFANLGFLLQIAGLFTILPIGIGLYFNETQAVVALLLTCVAFLGCGFLLNALCERKDLDFKCSNWLFLVAFIVLPLIGAIPYFYSSPDPFGSANILDKFTNGYFESISGFTTTGFSFIAAPEALPQSMLVYRSMTELMGGVGIVFLLLAFFNSRKSLNNLSTSLGVDNVNGSLKKTYFSVFAIYSVYIIAFTAIFYGLGFTNLINTGTFVIDTITGGFQPAMLQYQQYMSLTPKILIIVLMLLGSLNFAFSYHLFTLKLRKVISAEILAYMAIIAVGTVSIAALANVGVLDSLFHVVSMSSSTGQSYIPLASFGNTAYSILIVLMLIGGCTFSMAGGIRLFRMITFGKSVKENIVGLLVKEHAIAKPKKTTSANESWDTLSAPVSILLFIFVLVIFAVIFTTIGVSFTDALFEVGSALTTNGISMGATTVTMGIGYKWLMIAAMTIGRVEMLSILIALVAFRRK
jgi:trk system potassium uptake protein TrkH